MENLYKKTEEDVYDKAENIDVKIQVDTEAETTLSDIMDNIIGCEYQDILDYLDGKDVDLRFASAELTVECDPYVDLIDILNNLSDSELEIVKEWCMERINESEMLKIEADMLKYDKKIKRNIFRIIYKVFGVKEITAVGSNYVYDYLIETKKMKIYCKIIQEEGSFHFFWKKWISIISDRISFLNKEKNVKLISYIIIVIESKYGHRIHVPYEDYIYPNIYISNPELLEEDLKTIKKLR